MPTTGDSGTLHRQNWLSGPVADVGGDLARDMVPEKVHFPSSLFYAELYTTGHGRMKGRAENVHIFSPERLLTPRALISADTRRRTCSGSQRAPSVWPSIRKQRPGRQTGWTSSGAERFPQHECGQAEQCQRLRRLCAAGLPHPALPRPLGPCLQTPGVSLGAQASGPLLMGSGT